MKPFMDIDTNAINNILKGNPKPDISIVASVSEMKNNFSVNNGRHPTIDEMRQMQVSVYALSRTG